jgi:2-keto-3-deoxy-L-rhamnonate aldolase RhmA
VLIGTVVTLADPVLAELLGAPFDLVWIDLEHAALTVAAVPALAVALRAAGCRAEVRLPSWRSEALPPVLDAGVDGVVAPCVESADDAGAFVRRLRHPPAGTRGYGPRRAGGYGRCEPPVPSCSVQIESVAGVEAAAAIASVEGVDAVVAGCADLARSVGRNGLGDAVEQVRTAARASGKRFGIAGAPAELARGGADVLIAGVDVRLYAAAADRAAADARAGLAAAGGAAADARAALAAATTAREVPA